MKEILACSCRDEMEMRMQKEVFENAGVTVLVKTHSPSVVGMAHNALFPFEIFVSEEDAEKAKELLLFGSENAPPAMEQEEALSSEKTGGFGKSVAWIILGIMAACAAAMLLAFLVFKFTH